MSSSVEACFLINFAVDAALIGVVARANGCFRARRAALAALIGALYALSVARLSPRLAHPAVQLALIVPVALIVSGDPDPRRWGAIAFQLLCGALLLGGAGALLPERFLPAAPAALAAGLAALAALLGLRRRRINGWEVTVLLSVRGRTAGFRALIDTGKPPARAVSGLPVLIAESALVKGLLAADAGRRAALPFHRLRSAGRRRHGALLPAGRSAHPSGRAARPRAGGLGRGLSRQDARPDPRPRAAFLRARPRRRLKRRLR